MTLIDPAPKEYTKTDKKEYTKTDKKEYTETKKKECKLPVIIKEDKCNDNNVQCELTIKIMNGTTHRELKGSPTFTEVACMLYELEIMKQELLNLEFDD